MRAKNGAGLAAPQIGVSQQVVIFGVGFNPRYPDAEEVPYTVLINPVLEPIGDEMEEGWEGCLSVPGMRGVVPRYANLRYQGYDPVRQSDRPHRHRLSRPRGAARIRSPDGHSLSDAHPRPAQLRLQRRAVSRTSRSSDE